MENDVKQQIVNLRQFIPNWNNKADDYKNQEIELNAVFDEFITRYIIFNVLYKVCAQIYGKTGDRNSATKVTYDFLKENGWRASSEIKLHIDDLNAGIINGRFKIGIKDCPDKKLISDLQSYDILALLKCIYQLRCNLFHGDKEFIWRQAQLLAPATRCLEIINNSIYQILANL